MVLQLGGPAFSLGTLVAFVSLQQGLLRPTVSLLTTGVQMQTSLALFQRIFEYLDLPVAITEPVSYTHMCIRDSPTTPRPTPPSTAST